MLGEGRRSLPDRAHISPYANARQERQLPTRDRKLLLHRKEIDRLIGKSQEEGRPSSP